MSKCRKNLIQQIAMMLLALALNSASAWADNVNYFDPTAAVGQQTKTATNPTAITANTETLGTTGQTTWYYVSGTFTNDRRIDVLGTVNIILVDDCKFTASKGIRVESSNALNIYAQKAGDGCGKLIAKHSNNHAAIGGNRGNDGNGEAGAGETSGTIAIYGGNIVVNGNIGGGDGGTGYYIGDNQGIGGKGGNGTIIIYDGHITVDGNMGGGKGGDGEGVPMYSGEYDEYGDPIVLYYDGGQGGDGGTGTVTINGGYVDVRGSMGAGYSGDGYAESGNEGSGDVSFSWSKPSDMFSARSYNGTVRLLKPFMDSDKNVYEGDYKDGIRGDARIINKWLYPYGTMYDINIGGNYDPACLESEKARAMEGAEIKLTAVNGYKVSSVTVTYADDGNVSVNDNQNGTWTFTMPAKAVTVTATATRFYQVSGSNNISCDVADANDKIVQNGKTYYRPEAAVNFQVTVPDGYFIQSLTVKDEDSQDISYVANGTNAYTFTMPAKAVTMEAVTMRDFSELTLIEGKAAFTVTGGNNYDFNDGPENLLDGKYSSTDDSNYSKWVVDDVTTGCYVEFNTPEPVIPKFYTLISSDFEPFKFEGCYPICWTIEASASGNDGWTTIATESYNYTMYDELACHSYIFDFNNPDNNTYQYFRFTVTEVEGLLEEPVEGEDAGSDHNWLELSEMQMYVRSETLAAVTNGTCGDISINRGNDVTWKYNTSTKVLTISGTGPMMYYGSALGTDNKYHSTAPWSKYDDKIEKVVVENGVTYIGSYAFAYCTALTSVSLPASVVALGNYVCYTSNVIRIDIPSTTAATLGEGGFGCCSDYLQIIVPSTLLGTYRTAVNWSTYAVKLVGSLNEVTGFDYRVFVTGKYEFKRTLRCGVSSTICLPFGISADQASSVGRFYSFVGIDKSGDQWTVIMQEEVNQVKDGLVAYRPYLFIPYILDGMRVGDEFDFTFCGSVSSLADAGAVCKEVDNYYGSNWSFQGVFFNTLWDEDHNSDKLGKIYGFAANSYDGGTYTVNPGDFVKAGAGASIAPFHAYLEYTFSNTSSAPMRGGTRTEESLPSSMKVKLISADGSVTAVGNIDVETGEVTIDTWSDMNGRILPEAPVEAGMYIHNGKQVLINY